MKKILLGSAAAICAAVGFSSFKVAHNNGTYYWFLISKNTARAGVKPVLKNADITHGYAVSTTSTTLPPLTNFSSCNGTSYYCVGGFTTAQLTAGHNYLKTSAILSQTPFTAGYTRN